MAGDFAVHLGGGAYLDDAGNLTFGAPSATQVYEAPGGFSVDAKKLQETFKDLSDILPGDAAAKAKWMKWGVPSEVVDFLGRIAGTAGIVATAVSASMWVLGVFLTLLDAAAGEGLSPELARALDGIKNKLTAVEQQQVTDLVTGLHADFDGPMGQVKALLTRLVVEQPEPAAKAEIYGQMLSMVNQLFVPLSKLRDQPWGTSFDGDVYKGRAFAAKLLVFERSDGTLASVPMEPETVTHFNYRLGVPILLFGCTTFAIMLRAAMPWFRSAGMYAAELRKNAEAIDTFVLRVQNKSISRTEYTAQMVLQQQMWPLFDIADPASGQTSPNGPFQYPTTLAAGAFDLVAYNDAFLVQRWTDEFVAGEDTGPRGLFNYHWQTPEPDPQKIADAANEQAKQDYADLQVASGMYRLISTAAWLRFLSTPPKVSETVSGSVSDSRSFKDSAPFVATSPSIFPARVISSPATLKRYEACSRFQIATQPPGYVPAFRYRIVLRTIDSKFSEEAWAHREYVGDIWHASYEPTGADARNKRMRTEVWRQRILSDVVLYEGQAPSEAVTRNGEAALKAATFDWYVPVGSPWSRYVGSAVNETAVQVVASEQAKPKQEASTGGVSIHLLAGAPIAPTSMFIKSNPGPLVSAAADELSEIPHISAVDDVSLAKAERRHVEIEDVAVTWQLTWNADKLQVILNGRPEDRPFQAYIVVEETVYSGEVGPENPSDILSDAQFREQIHTPFAGEIVNQLAFVPASFFEEEREAMEAGSKMLGDIERRYAESARVGPGDPVEALQKSIRDRIRESASTATYAEVMDLRADFARVQAPELWNAVVPESHRNRLRSTRDPSS